MLLKPKKSAVARQLNPFEDPSSIGNVLLRLGKITRPQLLEAVGQRAQFDELLLGGLLKQLGFVGEFDVALALKVQAEMRRGNPLAAELDVLQSKMDEAAQGARELASCIALAKADRRERGEKSGFFLAPRAPVRARA